MKPIIIISSLLLLAIGSASCQQTATRSSFEIKGHITGLKNDSIIVYAPSPHDKGNIKGDSFPVIATNGRFSIKGTVNSARQAYIITAKGSTLVSFVLEPGTISIEGDLSDGEPQITGTPENDIMKDLNATEKGRYQRIRSMAKIYRETSDTAEQARLGKKVALIRDSIMHDRLAFVETHPASLNSASFIYVISSDAPLERLAAAYTHLDGKLKNMDGVKAAFETIKGRKRTAIGSPAPAFTINDVNGTPVSLSSFQGKYVLLEFWASWCVPCRQQIPALKAAYEKYKDKGFTILSISVDADKHKWEKALKEENLAWMNVRDVVDKNRPADSSLARLYGVTPIPDNFLVGPDGKILERGVEGAALDAKLAAILK